MQTHHALIIRPSLALLQVAGYTAGGQSYWRRGEARSYDHPERFRGPVAIFASRAAATEQGLPDKHFPSEEDCAAHMRAAKPWCYRLVGFVELLRVVKPGDKDYQKVYRLSWNLDHGDSLFYETRPIVGSLANPETAPLFTEACCDCIRLAKSPKLKDHQISSHTRWNKVSLPERLCP